MKQKKRLKRRKQYVSDSKHEEQKAYGVRGKRRSTNKRSPSPAVERGVSSGDMSVDDLFDEGFMTEFEAYWKENLRRPAMASMIFFYIGTSALLVLHSHVLFLVFPNFTGNKIFMIS